jgi:hypothetical protein
MNEIRFALRQLRKSPAFSCLTVLTLAIAIGMNTAMFSLIHDLLLRGLPNLTASFAFSVKQKSAI